MSSMKSLQLMRMFRKCLAEEIRNGVLVTGDYTVTEMAGQQVEKLL